jgi:hypothetical protein
MSNPRRALVLSLTLAAVLAAPPAAAADGKPAPAPAAATPERCPHGVQKTLCTRCNPKLAPVFKAKGDWCPEHARPESQCVLCHPELAKQGIK